MNALRPWASAGQWVQIRAIRRAGVPAEEQVTAPAWAWAVVAVGLAAGPWLQGSSRWLAAGLLCALTTSRPLGRRWLWVALAVAVLAGGWRADAIDRSALRGMLDVGADRGRADRGRADRGRAEVGQAGGAFTVTLREPLPASGPAGTRPGSALATADGRTVMVMATRFGRPSPPLPRGAIVRVEGKALALRATGADARLRRLGVGARILSTTIAWDGRRRGGALGAVDRFGSQAQGTLVKAVGPRRGALLAGMALGLDDGIGEADAGALRASGLWHLVAASGGNIALVVALVMALGWAVGLPDRWRLLACAVAIVAYVPLAGSGPSIVRAGAMGLAGLLALGLGREHRGADALAFAAVVTLLLDPRATLDVGWQLSFVAAGALIGGAGPVGSRLAAMGVPRWLALGMACTVVATVATAPVMLLTFGELSLIGLVTNAVVLPLVGLAVWSGALAAVLTPVAPAVAGVVAEPGGVAAGLTLAIAAWGESRTHAVVGWEGALVVVAGAALLRTIRPPRPITLLALAGALAWLSFAVPRPPSEPRLVVFDIGQGSAVLLQDGSEGVLVDTGPVDGGLVAALRRTGIRRLRAVILSHPAADHDGGGAAVIDAFPTDLLLDGGEPGGGPTHDAAVRAARRRSTPIVAARRGQRLAFGRVTLQIRWPTPRAAAQPGNPNDRAAVVDAQVGTLRALLPADAEANVLRALPGLRTDVLVVSHHGSSDEALPGLLRTLRPKLAVISVGAANTYGHPTRPTLQALRDARVPTLRTDQAGAVDLRAGPGGVPSIRREIAP